MVTAVPKSATETSASMTQSMAVSKPAIDQGLNARIIVESFATQAWKYAQTSFAYKTSN